MFSSGCDTVNLSYFSLSLTYLNMYYNLPKNRNIEEIKSNAYKYLILFILAAFENGNNWGSWQSIIGDLCLGEESEIKYLVSNSMYK